MSSYVFFVKITCAFLEKRIKYFYIFYEGQSTKNYFNQENVWKLRNTLKYFWKEQPFKIIETYYLR